MRGKKTILVWAGIAALSVVGAGSNARAQQNIYESIEGLSRAANSFDTLPSGMNLNPLGVGDFLVGTYYDVREVDGDAQFNNIQIINTNTNNTGLPGCAEDDIYLDDYCYNPIGGILAKVRFRESKTSKEVLDFNIALSCGEVWAARVELGANGLPQIASQFPVVTSANANELTTRPAFDPNNGGAAQGFAPTGLPAGISNEDVQRGHFEVVGIEALPCEPESGALSLDGNTWARLGQEDLANPSNEMGGQVFLVRAGAGVSHNYNMPAISNYANAGMGPVDVDNLFGNDTPAWSECNNYDLVIPGGRRSASGCVEQSNIALAKSRIIAQYDVDPITAGRTLVVVTFPNKYENCAASNGTWTGSLDPESPFECGAQEEIVCTLYDRLENYVEEDEDFISPNPAPGRCVLDREVNVLQLALSAADQDPRADQVFATGALPAGQSGWLDLDLVRDPDGNVIHEQNIPAIIANYPNNVLGMLVTGTQGLPAEGLVIQEFFNGNVGGSYGNTVTPLYEQVLLADIS